MHSETSDLPLDFEFRGKPYLCSLITDDVMTRYERREFNRACDRLDDQKRLFSEKEFRRERRRLRRAHEEGEFSLKTLLGRLREKGEAGAEEAGRLVLPLMIMNPDKTPVSALVLTDMTLTIPQRLVELLAEASALAFPPMAEEVEELKKKAMPEVLRLSQSARELLHASS